MLGIANMTEISRHYTHSIYTDSHRFFTAFAPDDLVRRCGGQFQVIRGLEHVLEHRMAACLNNLRTLAELRRTSSAGNTLPDYVEIHEEGGVLCGESRYYSYEVLQTEDDMRFCRKLAAVCDWMKQLIAELGKEPVAEWDDIIFEKGSTEALHVLHLDVVSAEKSPLCFQLRNLVVRQFFGRAPRISDHIFELASGAVPNHHPRFSVLVCQLIQELAPVRSNAQRWETLSAIAHALCDLLESDPDYFLRPCVLKRTASFPIAEEIKREFQSGNHVVFLSSKNVLRLRQAADSYRFQNHRRYLHTAQGTAENGLSAMLEGETFALHSGASSAAARISAMRGMCADGMLLVVENCDIENDPLFRQMLRLPADILLLTPQDYGEYGFPVFEV